MHHLSQNNCLIELRFFTSRKKMSEEVADIVKVISEEAQKKDGDCLPKDYICSLPEKIRPDLKQNDLTELVDIWKKWDSEKKIAFQEKYGDLALLLTVEVDVNLIRAMVHFWDPSYRCFVFNEADMVPTIEEYMVLLRVKESNQKIYKKNKMSYRKSLARMIDVNVQEVDPYIKKKGEGTYIAWDFLRNCFNKQLTKEQSMSLMALAIYGMVIFPRALQYVEIVLVDLVEQLEHEVNVVPAILAETFRSLSYCRQTGGGRFIGCMQLLHIWMKSHFKCEESKFKDVFLASSVPIKEFCNSEWPKSKTKKKWVSTLRKITSQEIVWLAPWMPRRSMLYKCGGQPWVILLGVWGTITYSPIMVRRQLGYDQFIPMTYGLNRREYSYTEKGALRKIEEDVKAWKTASLITKGRFIDKISPEYSVWHARRAKDIKLPLEDDEQVLEEPLLRDPMIDLEIAKRKLQEENDELQQENKRLRKEMQAMSNQHDEEIQRSSQEKRKLQKMIDFMKKKLATNNPELARVKQENERLEAKVEAKELKNKELQKKIDDTQAQVEKVVQEYMKMEKDMIFWNQECGKWKEARDTRLLEKIFVQINMVARVADDIQRTIANLRDATSPIGYYKRRLLQFLDMAYEHYGLLGRLVWEI